MSLHNSRNAPARGAGADGEGDPSSSAVSRGRSRLLAWAFPFVAALAVAVILPAAASAATQTISGTVTTAAGGPVANIDVDVYDAGGSEVNSTTTAADGTYSLTVDAGVYDVGFFDETGTYADQWYNDEPTEASADPLTVTGSAPVTGVNATLSPSGTISGTVTDAATSAVLTGGEVYVIDSQGDYAGSSAISGTGTYSVNGLLSGSYKLEFVGGSGYTYSYYGNAIALQSSTSVSVAAGSTTTANGSVEPDASAVGISGEVTNGAGTPIQDAGVELFDTNNNYVYDWSGESDASAFAYTAADGTYTLSDLPPGGYKVEFYSGSENLGFQFYNLSSTFAGATVESLTPGETVTSINGALTTGGKVSGTVTDAATGAAVADTEVELLDSSGEVLDTGYTQSNGTYTMNGIPTGTYYVEFAPIDTNAGADKEYALQYWKDADTLAQATAVPVTAGATTSGIDAGLLTDASETPATITNVVTKTIIQTPPTVSGSVKVSRKDKASVKFTVKAGQNAPALKSLTIKLPSGLSFNKKKLKKALSVKGAKYSEKLSKGSLVITLKSASSEVKVSIGSKGVTVSKTEATAAKKGHAGTLTARIAIKDANNRTTNLTF